MIRRPHGASSDRLLRDALALQAQGRNEEAERIYLSVLRIDARHPDALRFLGGLRIRQGRHPEAIGLISKALSESPGIAEAHCNLGVALRGAGRHEEAITSYRRAIAIKPDYALAHYNLANALGTLDRLEEAVASYRNALGARPDHAEAHNNLGNALSDLGRCEEAIGCYAKALALKPEFAEAHNNLGRTLHDLQRHEEALASFERALEIDPGYAAAHFHRSLSQLALGDYPSGWREYEWRWRVSRAERTRSFAQPLWLGDRDLSGRRILLYAEQGYGDAIQFVRYAPLVAKRGARVVLQVPEALKSLLACVRGVESVLVHGDPLPELDFQCPLMSLPLAFGTRLDSVPAAIPYLHADHDAARHWAGRVAAAGDGRKVGLVWAGSAGEHNPAARRIDQRRSIALAQLEPLAQAGGVRFFSLQKGEPGRQARDPPRGMSMVDFSGDLRDFSDTAALVSCLDLVITVDTAVAHLAAAIGKPVWVLSRFDACWRWLARREDSPWYPTVRLFRQHRMGDWARVIERVRDELQRIE